jgi:hypothetical protein
MKLAAHHCIRHGGHSSHMAHMCPPVPAQVRGTLQQQKLKVLCGTWNVNEQRPADRSLREWLTDRGAKEAQVVCVALQEMEMGTGSVVKDGLYSYVMRWEPGAAGGWLADSCAGVVHAGAWICGAWPCCDKQAWRLVCLVCSCAAVVPGVFVCCGGAWCARVLRWCLVCSCAAVVPGVLVCCGGAWCARVLRWCMPGCWPLLAAPCLTSAPSTHPHRSNLLRPVRHT